MRWLLPLFLIPLLMACGGGDDDEGSDAGTAAVAQFEDAIRGQWGRVYDTLLPEHQDAVPEDLYVRCMSENTFADMDITVDEVFQESIDVPLLGETDTSAVTLKFDDGETSQFTTRHLVERDGEWYWILSQEALEAFEAGECP